MKWALLVFVAACGDGEPLEEAVFAWTGEHDLGAHGIDKIRADDPGLADAIDRETVGGGVVLFYGHDPPNKTRYETVEAIFDQAHERGLAILTYADLANGPSRPGVSVSFDDDEVDDWYAMRDLLRAHDAHVSFFVTHYAELTDTQKAELHELAADGNTIEAHGVHHLGATKYIAEHGLDAYLELEVQPSIDVLRADGFAPVAYAHPGGFHTPELDLALASRIRFARGIRGAPR